MEYIWVYISGILVLAYLLGSIPFSLWIGLIFFHTDIRREGSGNAGTTNTFRVLGWKAGIPVFMLDVMKGWIAVNLACLLPAGSIPKEFQIYLAISLAICVVIGHIRPVFAGFKGGKGVATLLGIGIALYPVSGPAAFGVFLIVFPLSGYVSLSSILACISFPFLSYFLCNNTEIPLVILSVAVAVFVPLTHLKNIKRLLAGTESRFLYKSKK
ncbi:MAG: glycerol-3-phosphate 1-O-acyltransferase PlsY [Bacteroidetes bacterium]|nr:glycerol-3-phosphate 1-O-acyltransferase PlsY [Bacteroidota bacterium]MCK5766036.1 glycerol-3-phosphate 1-O-acyltransferase PlsY [Bacteroidales bacterium]